MFAIQCLNNIHAIPNSGYTCVIRQTKPDDVCLYRVSWAGLHLLSPFWKGWVWVGLGVEGCIQMTQLHSLPFCYFLFSICEWCKSLSCKDVMLILWMHNDYQFVMDKHLQSELSSFGYKVTWSMLIELSNIQPDRKATPAFV